ncbi:MAG: capsule assembly Wzi family protein [candidate division Zixibacteria bacterium]
MNSRIVKPLSSVALLCAVILCTARVSGDVIFPYHTNAFKFDYDLADHSAVRIGNLDLIPAVGPFDFSIIEQDRSGDSLSPAMRLIALPEDRNLRLFSIAGETVHSRNESAPRDYFSFAGGMRYQPSKHFGSLVMFSLDRSLAVDHSWDGIKWRGLAGEMETAAIFFRKGKLKLTFGRQRLFWGPKPVNLVLSAAVRPLDLLSAQYRMGRLSYSFVFARIDKSRPNSADSLRFPEASFQDNRYLAGHRIDFRMHKQLRVGLFETVLYGGEGRPIELYYLNPLQFYHGAQLNADENDNTILGIDFNWMPFESFSLYSQFIIDDFQIDKKVQGDQEPDEIGLMVGAMRSGSVGSMNPDISFEYVRITNRTYNQALPRNRYLYRNQVLGHPLGPDADSLSMTIRFWPSRFQTVAFELAASRHGEGSIYDEWDEPWQTAVGDYDEPFPTGVVARSVSAAIRIAGYLPLTEYTSKHMFINFQAGYGSTRNFGNIDGNDMRSSWLKLSFDWVGSFEIGLGR